MELKSHTSSFPIDFQPRNSFNPAESWRKSVDTFRHLQRGLCGRGLLRALAAATLSLSAPSRGDADPYSVLRDFSGGASDGALPFGSVTVAGSTVYGMTTYGGA